MVKGAVITVANAGVQLLASSLVCWGYIPEQTSSGLLLCGTTRNTCTCPY